jgi:thymidylate synthase (FAD)
MSVNIISISEPFIRTQDNSRRLTPEECIVYCARVSNPSNQLNTESSSKLLNYLITHKHWSPFEMISMCLEIKTTRAIAAQILRHRSFSFQEFSQRYSVATEVEPIEWRKQGKTNRQVGDTRVDVSSEISEKIYNHQKETIKLYENLIGTYGMAKECARMILPLNTKTTIYMSGTIRSWLHYVDIRSKEDTQKEHRNIALQIKNILIERFPETSKALSW